MHEERVRQIVRQFPENGMKQVLISPHPSLRGDEARLEVNMVRKSMAQVEGERYTLEANKRTLLEQLRLRWGPLPAEIEQVIQNTRDNNQLVEWLRGVITASDLEAMGIAPPR